MINFPDNQIKSRYNENIIFFILCGTALSFLLSLTLLQLFTAALSILWLTENNSEKKKSFNYISALFTLFILMRLISVIFSEFPQTSYQSIYKDALFYLSFFSFSFYIQYLSIKSKSRLFNMLIFSALIVGITGIVLYNLGIKHRAASFVSGYMTYSAFLLGGFGFFIFRKFSFIPKYRNIVTGLTGSVILSGIILAMSRVDILVACVFLLVSILVRPGKLVYTITIILITALIVLLSFNNNRAEAERRISNPGSLSDRNILWTTAYDLSGNHVWLGYGPRTFDNIFKDKNKLSDKSIGSWHNDYITILMESGIFTLLLFLMLISAIYIKALRIIKLLSKSGRILMLGGLLLISTLFISAFTSGFINNPILAIFFSFGYAFVNDQAKEKSNRGIMTGS